MKKEMCGLYGRDCIVYANTLEEEAEKQIQGLLDHPVSFDNKIRIMPDVHAGAGCTIGTTMSIKDKIIPNHVGVDIGCGMLVSALAEKVDPKKLDAIIREKIPSGFNVRNTPYPCFSINLSSLVCGSEINIQRAELSIGTLGGGNHFIELSQNKFGEQFLIIHSGSRNAGKQVADHYQKLAVKRIYGESKVSVQEKEMAWLEGEDMNDYLHDMQIMQAYADLNRFVMANIIDAEINRCIKSQFSTIHNYINTTEMILRKGAVSAKQGDLLLIPMNMRDGSLLCIGKGNSEWNNSAPHGAGRLMSRKKARESINMEEYTQSMIGIYSTSVCEDTIDEAPFAYKPMQEIVEQIGETVDVIDILKPIYNFKAAEKNGWNKTKKRV